MEIRSECKELISIIIAMPAIACRKSALVRVGKKQEKTSPNRNDIMSFWLMETNARAAFWDMFNSMGGPLGVFSSEL